MSDEQSLSIVIIDDSIYIQKFLKAKIEALEYKIVGSATTGKESFNVVANTRPDLVLLDYTLNDMDTESTLRGLLSINQVLQVVIMAPITRKAEIFRLLVNGASDYLPKPLVESQIEFILNTYAFNKVASMLSRMDAILRLHSVFYKEIAKYTAIASNKLIKNAIQTPLKRLKRTYPERYNIQINTMSIRLQENYSKSPDFSAKKILRQINNLYRSILKNLSKHFEQKYLFSCIQEAYQNFYLIAGSIIKNTKYEFPVWEGLQLSSNPASHATIRYTREYLHNYVFDWVYEVDNLRDPERLKPYSVVLNFDPRLAPKFPTRTARQKDFRVYVILSVFDEIYGPKAAIILPPPTVNIEKETLKNIPKLLDMSGVRTMDPFIHASENYGSINMLYSVEREDRRGQILDQMISIVIYPLDIQALVKVSQMKGIFSAVVAQISYLIRTMDPEELADLGKFTTEPSEILSEFVNEIHFYL